LKGPTERGVLNGRPVDIEPFGIRPPVRGLWFGCSQRRPGNHVAGRETDMPPELGVAGADPPTVRLECSNPQQLPRIEAGIVIGFFPNRVAAGAGSRNSQGERQTERNG